MKKSFNILSLILFALALLSCEKENNLEPNPNTIIEFQVEQKNSNNDFISNVEKILNITKNSRWDYSLDTVILIKEINIDLLLTNDDTLNFGLWFLKYDNRNLVNLYADTLIYTGKDWDYIDFDNEVNNFYKNFNEARVLINNNVFFHHEISPDFKILSIDEIFIEGKNKSLIEISFEGTAYGWYDPHGEYKEFYKIKNGFFKGIIEQPLVLL